jgi:hypothetical protein
MPINESTRKAPHERWPLEFDLEGVPRDTDTRKQLLQQKNLINQSGEEFMQVLNRVQPQNHFTVDPPKTAEITDINNPPKKNYNPRDPKNEYPKMLYHHGTGRVLHVANEKEQKAAMKRGFELKPSPDYDYSKVSRAGIAAKASSEPKREEEMSAEELAAMDEADEGS